MLTEFHSDVRQHETPYIGAEQRVDGERDEFHPRHAGGKRDEGADHRQHPAPEDGMRTPSLEEAIGSFEFMRRDQEQNRNAR